MQNFKKLNFRDAVIRVVRKIPRGKTRTYGEVAVLAGHPRGARAVGAIMRSNADKSVPCHRVVGKNDIGGYNGLRGRKRALLLSEGAIFR